MIINCPIVTIPLLPGYRLSAVFFLSYVLLDIGYYFVIFIFWRVSGYAWLIS